MTAGKYERRLLLPVPVSRCSVAKYPKTTGAKQQPFHYSRGFCGSGTPAGHGGAGLFLLRDVWASEEETPI